MKPSSDEIQATIVGILTEMTSDWDLDEPLDPGSRLSGDLGFSSVDLLELFAGIDMRLKRKLRYEKLLTNGDGKFRQELSVRELASFVHDHYEEVVGSEPVPM